MAREEADPEGFGGRLKSALKKAGMSQRTLADRLQLQESAVSNWIRGVSEKPRDVQTLVQIARILHTSIDYLLGVPGAPEPRNVQAEIEAAVKRARDEMRGAILGAFDEGSSAGRGSRKK